MFSKETIERAKADFLFATNILIVSNVVDHFLINKELFNNHWLLSGTALIISFVIHALVIQDLNKVNESNIRLKQFVNDLLRFGSIFIITEIIGTYFIYGHVKISLNFIKRASVTLLGILSFSYFFMNRINNLGVYTVLVNDILRIFSGFIASVYLIDGYISTNEMSRLMGLLGGFISWHLITSKIIIR